MILWTEETKNSLATNIANRLSDKAENRLAECYYETKNHKLEFYIDEVVENILDNYFKQFDIDDVIDDLPDEMIDENGYFKENEYSIDDEIRDLLETKIIEKLKSILKDYAEDFDYSDPNELSTYGLSEKDFY